MLQKLSRYNAKGTAGEIILLVKYSLKRENLLGKLKNQIEHNSKEITKLPETQWTIVARCFKKIVDNYDALSAVLEHCIQNDKLNVNVKSHM